MQLEDIIAACTIAKISPGVHQRAALPVIATISARIGQQRGNDICHRSSIDGLDLCACRQWDAIGALGQHHRIPDPPEQKR